MATLYDGVPVFAPVAGNTALAADQVTLQAKLILGLEERTVAVRITDQDGMDSAAVWTWQGYPGANPPYYSMPGVPANQEMLITLPFLRSVERITEIGVSINGAILAGDAGGGTIELYERPINATPSAWAAPAAGAVPIGGARPFEQGGMALITSGAIAFDVVAQAEYAIRFVAGSAVAGRTHFVYGIYYKAMFHKGT